MAEPARIFNDQLIIQGDPDNGPFDVRVGADGDTLHQLGKPIGRTNTTLESGDVTFAVTSSVMVVTGAASVTIATITNGHDGQLLTLVFVEGNVVITDTATEAADTVNLSAAFTGADGTVLQLVYDGTSWREVSRSVNG